MISSNMPRQPKPILETPRKNPAKTATMRDSVSLQDKIRERAHQLFESRGCQPGQDQEDWLRAEQEILNHR